MKKGEHFVVGADFGTDSVRVVILDAFDGSMASSAVASYPRWAQGLYCDPKANQFRQHPLDHIESFEKAVKEAGLAAPEATKRIKAMCIDTTGSTVSLVDGSGQPLALDKRFADDPAAMFVLWKDHTAVIEADEFNHLSRSWGGEDYTQYMGGTYSSEWFWAKLLHLSKQGGPVIEAAKGAVEHCDWFPALLTDTTAFDRIKRSRCAAGHKIAWHQSWGGYPSKQFLEQLHPFLAQVQSNLGTQTYTSDIPIGALSPQWAQQLGLPATTLVCVGSYDAHIGAVGGHVAEKVMVKSIGTSTCDIIIGPRPKEGESEVRVAGIAGQVDGSVVPGYIGYEAGQSAYGDFYAWFRDLLYWPVEHMETGLTDEQKKQLKKGLLASLEQAAEKIQPQETSAVALDWINGRRSPHADQLLKGALSGLSLGTDAPMVMRMLLEATAYGARAILECYEEGGVYCDKVVAIGGVARKSRLGMQILADVTARDIHVTSDDQAPAIGAAVFASVAAGLYTDVQSAQQALCAPVGTVYTPNKENTKIYDTLYSEYLALGAYEQKQRRS